MDPEIEAQLDAELAGKVEQPDTPDQEALDAEMREHEADAKKRGWTPKEEFKGDPTKWVDAKTFNQRSERYKRNLENEVASLRKEIADFKGTAKAFAKFQQDQIDAKDAELQDARAALKQQQRQAIREGDDDLAENIDKRLEAIDDKRKELKDLKKQDQDATRESLHPEQVNQQAILQEWIDDDNEWFQNDPKLREHALLLGDLYRKKGDTTEGREFLDKVAARVRKDFPRSFRDKQSAAGSRVESERDNTASRTSGGMVSERDLPAEDLALMRQGIAEGWTTKEKFLKGYSESHAARQSGKASYR